jgi:hypothetical protein
LCNISVTPAPSERERLFGIGLFPIWEYMAAASRPQESKLPSKSNKRFLLSPSSYNQGELNNKLKYRK